MSAVAEAAQATFGAGDFIADGKRLVEVIAVADDGMLTVEDVAHDSGTEFKPETIVESDFGRWEIVKTAAQRDADREAAA